MSNDAAGSATNGIVTVTENVPNGLTLVSMAGSAWNCNANTCTRSDVLTPGTSYPDITVSVNVDANAPSSVTNGASVSGGGSPTANATDPTPVIAPANAARLSVTKTHTGNFLQNQSNAKYTLTVSNAPSAAPTSGTVTVTDTIPSGLTLVSMAGNAWSCVANACTRSDTLAGGASYPPLTVTVNVSGNAPVSVVNTVNVSGGSSLSATANDTTLVFGVPLILATAPVTGSQGRTLANVIVTGQSTHFVQGTTIGNFGAGITVNSLAVNSPTSATVSITIASSATPGSQSVTVTTGAEIASLLNGFFITAPVAGLTPLTWLGGGHTGGVRSVGAAPDGTVWSAGGDNTIKQWNAANMNMLRTFPLVQTGAAFAGNGQQGLVIGSGGVQSVSLADGSVSRTFALGDYGAGASLPAISANGQTVAFQRISWGPNFLVFANGQGSETDVIASSQSADPDVGFFLGGIWTGGVNVLAVSPDGQYVAAVFSLDVPGTIRLYRVSDGTLVRLLNHNTTNVQALAFSPDGALLASSSADGKINVLRLSDLVVVSSISVFESGTLVPGTALAFSPDGTQIAQGDSFAARIYHLPDGLAQGRIAGATASVAFTPDGQWLVVGNNKDVRLWLVATLAPLPSIATHSGSITAVAYSPRGDLAASASADLTVKLRSAVDGSLIASLTGHTDVVNALAFSPDGDMLATGSSDHTIRIWRTSDFTLLNTLTGHTQAVRTLAFSPDGGLLASGSGAPEEVVKLWSVGGTWSNTSTLTGAGGNVTAVQFSPDGQSVAAASDGGIVRLWQTATGALSRTYLAPSSGGMSLAFSPDGQLLIAGWGQNILVFQGVQTAPVFTVAAHSKSGTVVAYSPDGLRVLSGNPDGTLKLWNPAGWALVTSYNQETNAGGAGVTSVAYAPDSTRFVYGRGDATIGVASTGSTALPATVTVTTNPPGLAITVDGAAYIGPHTFSWTPGASHSVNVASPQGANGMREMFVGWSDGGAPSHSVTPAQSRIYTANFLTQYLLTSQTTPVGAGNIVAAPLSADGYYAAGTVVQLTETPATGFVFGSWSGGASGTTNAVSVLMNQPRSVTALFSGTALADIAVAMSSSVSQINSGKPLAFTVTVTNLGPAASPTSLTLIVNLPGAYTFVSASSSRGSCTGTVQISCPLGTVLAAGIVTATIDVTPNATGTIPMTASVNAGTADPNPANNSATVAVAVLPAGLPPILWMGGGDNLTGNIFPTADGTIWTTGPHELMLWRGSDMRLMRTIAPSVGGIYPYGDGHDFAVTPDGQYFAYGTTTNYPVASTVGVYRASDGSLSGSFNNGNGSANVTYSYSISLSDDGQKVAFLSESCGNFCNGAVPVIGNITTGAMIVISYGATSAVLSPDGNWLAVESGTEVRLYRASDGTYVRSLTGHIDSPDKMMWAADSDLLMTASQSEIKVWRISDFLQVQSITFPAQYWHSAAISRDGQYIAFGGAAPAATVWRVGDGSVVTIIDLPLSLSSVRGINFTLDNRWLVCGGVTLMAIALPEGTPSPYKTGNYGPVNALAYSSAGNLIATAGTDSRISVWDTAVGRVLSQVNWSGTNAISGLAFSPDGTKMAAGLDNNVSVWSTAGYSVAATMTGHSQPVTAVAFSPDGTLLASASAAPDQSVKLWSTQTWTLVRTLIGASGSLRSVQFSPDGTKVVAGDDGGIAREWNVTTGAVVKSYLASGQGAMRIQYSPDGTKLAAGWTSKVLLFNSGNSTPVQTLSAHTQNNTTVGWSPDSHRLISGNPDGTVDVWDTATWSQLSQYNSETYAQGGGVLTVAYSPDNSQFAYGRADAVLVAVDSGTAPTGTLTTVTTTPQGLNIVVDGTTSTSPQTFRWAAGTPHSIGVPSPQPGIGTRNVFAQWSDGGTQIHTITTPSTGGSFTAQFNQQYLLTAAVVPGASGSILVTPTSPDGYYDSGTAVQAVATANLGYVFGTWSGDATGTANPAAVAMTAPRSITANYSVLPTTVVTTNPPGLLITVDGTQYTGPQSFNWTAGASHTVAVSSTQGTRALRYTFGNWGDGGTISHTITAPSVSTTYIANLNTQYPLATNSNPLGGGTITVSPISADGYYNSGASVQLTDTAATGYRFTSWTGDVIGTTSVQPVTMSAARSVTANFAIVSSPILSIAKSHIGSFTQGQNGAPYTVTVSNTAGAGPTSGTVTVTETVPAGLTLVSMAGAGWACPIGGATCTRSDVLAIGASYPVIAVTVNVGASATSPQINSVSVSGGGSATATAADPATIAAGCSYSLSPNSASVAFNSGTGTLSVTASAGCAWTAVSNALWLTVTSGASGVGNGTVGYSFAANPNGTPRSGTLTIAGQTFTVTQAGVTLACSYSLSPASASVAFNSGTGSLSVTASAGCTWTAVSNASWLTVTSGASGSGSGTVGYSFATNPNGTSRSGTLTIAGQPFTVTQAGVTLACSYSLSSTSASVAFNSGTGSLSVTASAGCPWTGVSNASWLTVTSGALGSGSGTVGYSFATNPNGTSRSGTLTIAGQPFTVTQAGVAGGCSYSLSSTGISVSFNSGTGTLSVTASAVCTWTAVSNTPWLTVTSGTSGSGSGAVSYSFAANPNGTPRAGTVTIAGQTFTVTQAGVTVSGPQALRFVPVTPCRIADTRNPTGPFGGPALAGGIPRDFNVPTSPCGIPTNALAYSLNLTVVPLGPLGFLSVWPTGQSQPSVSTLNSGDGRIKANAAIVPAGVNGSVRLFASNPTQVIVDINGYFVPAGGAQNLAFYPITPCRLADTRGATGTFGGPVLAGNAARTFPVLAGPCGIPASAQAYAFNMTVVPTGPLGFLSAWPAGGPQPGSSTLNAPTGTVTANMAIIPAGTGGAITVIATNATDLIIDITGYFAPPGAGSLDFYTAIPCRILDTRGAAGAFGGPAMAAQSRSFLVSSSGCSIPGTAKAYSLNATVVPTAPLGFLTLWGSGSQPGASTLNSYDGTIVANAALVPAGINGTVTAITSDPSHLILDINGYFQ